MKYFQTNEKESIDNVLDIIDILTSKEGRTVYTIVLRTSPLIINY